MLVVLPYEGPSYERREPEQTVLHRVFLEHLETFLDRIGADTFALPKYALFLGVVRGWYGKQGKALGITECRGGSVTFAQRFGSALNLKPHFHSLVVDGVFNGKNANFHKAPLLRDEDAKEIVETVAHRVIRLWERQGGLDGDGYDAFSEEQPLLSGITAASVFSMVATGDRAGFRVRRVLSDPA